MYSISVVMPVYNEVQNIKKTLDIICNQTIEPLEVIVIDDCSIDNTYQTIKQIAMDNYLVHAFKNDKNMGAAQTRNRGLEIAKGDYIVFLDADDVFSPFFLEKMYRSIEDNHADVVCCKSEVVNMKDYSKRIFGQWKRLSEIIPEGEELIVEEPIEYPGIISLIDLVAWSKMLRRDYLLEHRINFQNISAFNDLSFALLSCLLARKIVFINEVLVEYHQFNDGSISSKRQENYCPIVEAYSRVLENETIYKSDNFSDFMNRALHNILAIAFEENRSREGRIFILEKLKNIYGKYDLMNMNIDTICQYSLEYIGSNPLHNVNKTALVNYMFGKMLKTGNKQIVISYKNNELNIVNNLKACIRNEYLDQLIFRENEGEYHVRELCI